MTEAKLRHPPGLYPLFFTEMWERFSFYCMMGILSLYMNESSEKGGLGFSNDDSTHVYGLYIGFVYFTPLFGGLIADRWWGYGRTIVLGGLFMMAGHFFLAFHPLSFFYSGLVCLVLGNGLFKPNISTMVGNLYRDRPGLKDAGFNIFYMGINIGAFTAPLVADWLKNSYGWHYAFGAAAVGMVISLVVFLSTRKFTGGGERPSDRPEAAAPVKREPPEVERLRIQALLIIYGVVALFWMAFHQNGSTMSFWARDNTQDLWRIKFPEDATLTQSINPFFVVAFTFPLIGFWSWLRRRGVEPSTPRKLILGMLLTATAFGIMGVVALMGAEKPGMRVSAFWLVCFYAVLTLGELCLSPMGLSLASKLAPVRHAGLLMGLWFVATGLGNYFSGFIGRFWDNWRHSTFFFFLTGTSLLAAVLLRVVLRKLEAAMPET